MATSKSSRKKGLLPTPRSNDAEKRGKVSGDRRNGLPGLICLPEAFPASLSATQENAEARMITAISGLRCCKSLGNLIQDGSLQKMLLVSYQWFNPIVQLEWQVKPIYSVIRMRKSEITEQLQEILTEISEKQGMKRIGWLFQLAPSAHPTDEIGSGLLPTPRVADTEGAPVKNVERNSAGGYCRKNQKGVTHGVKIKDVIAMLPTPDASDRRSKNSKQQGISNVITGTKTGLKLQPAFVEWMMGFPSGWTDLNLPSRSTAKKGSRR